MNQIDNTFTIKDFKKVIDDASIINPLIICSKRLLDSAMIKDISSHFNNCCFFCDYQANPLYKNVVDGINVFNNNKCDGIIAIGGGSPIDVAKCIKLFSKLENPIMFLEKKYKQSNIPLIVVPTTCGTGSEATKFAVIYYKGEKQSIEHDSILPDYVILEPSLIIDLPDYQKKSTMLDALCQSIESYWSINSNNESKKYSKISIELILNNYKNYLNNDINAIKEMQKGAYYSGRAINITRTTAAHAMSYKLTSLYGVAHGHAVAMCIIPLWQYMESDKANIIDIRGKDYFIKTMNEINNITGGLNNFVEIYNSLNMSKQIIKEDKIEELVNSVNVDRLKNHPVELNKETIFKLYNDVLINNF